MRRADTINKIYADLYNNVIPERVPNPQNITVYMMAEYGGFDPVAHHFDYAKLNEKAIEFAKTIRSDTVPIRPLDYTEPRPPLFYQALGSKAMRLSESGFMQHPEVVSMYDNEYTEFTKDPFAFVIDKALARTNTNLDPSNPFIMAKSWYISRKLLARDEEALLPAFLELLDSGDYYEGPPMGSFGYCEAPADFIADFLRSFSGFSMDIRRHRSQLIEACEAIVPLLFQQGLPEAPHPEGGILHPTHMPAYMREKDFIDIWFKPQLKIMQQYASLGARCQIILEHDWTRYLDIIQDFPAGTVLLLDEVDIKIHKEKLGKKFIISGGYPIDVLKYGTKQQVLDKAKEVVDIMAPGGGWIFGFNTMPLVMNDVNWENYIALTEFIEDYATYDNAGQSYGQKLNSEGFVYDEKVIGKPKSKYFFDWKDYKEKNPLTPDSARELLEGYDRKMVKEIVGLLL